MDQPQMLVTDMGTVGCHDTGGDGTPVLFVHGTPGGSDQGALMGAFLARAGHRVIAPSRPGYPGTTIETARTPAEQAELHLALMDHLGIDRFAVACWSGGGPSSYELARLDPGRVRAVVAIAAVSQPYTFEHPSEEEVMFGRPGSWLLRQMARHAPHATVSALVGEEGDLPKAAKKELISAVWDDEDTRQWVLDWSSTVTGDRSTGFANDREHFAHLQLDLAAVTMPVLLVHADTDADVAYDHSTHALSHLPDATLHTIHDGTHISAWTGPDLAATQAAVTDFLDG
jgi:pimeloyl-ACP methyl ester carboxylesterase